MARLSRDQILIAPDIKTVEIDVPEWGGSVLVRGLTGAQRDKFEMSILEIRGNKRIMKTEDIRAKLVALSIVDDAGAVVFTDSDIRALSDKSAAALTRVFTIARTLSGLADEDIEELEKNS
jgi:hypothetical protein